MTAAAPEEFEASEQELLPPSPIPVLDHERARRELRDLWDRGWTENESADRRAFEVACQEGTEPADIIAAARVWVAAYTAGDGVRYLPPLQKWLGDRGWEKKPKQGGRGKRNGNGGGSRSGKPDLLKMCLKHGGYVENEVGEMVWPYHDGDGDDDDDGNTITGTVS